MLGEKELNFLMQSNAIEGIHRPATPEEEEAFSAFLSHKKLDVVRIEKLVEIFQPDAKLRIKKGMNVRVGSYYPPIGGVSIGYRLDDLLERINRQEIDAFDAHFEYESLHPFTDGNGRSGRMIWWWMTKGTGLPLSFLHAFYYNALDKMGER